MRVLDLFSGIGGFSLGLERAGMRTVAFCETDEYCRAVLRKHWPAVPCFGDIRALDAMGLGGIGRVDLVSGGYPCQPFSHAGDRRGSEDPRHLWPEMRRVVALARPTWVVAENVTGHISMGLDQVLADLEADGYAGRALAIPACAVGAPHIRQRIWIVARNANSNSEPTGTVDAEASWLPSAVGDADCEGLSIPRQKPNGTDGRQARGMSPAASWWATEPGVDRVAHGVSRRVDRLRCLGNAVVPQVVEEIGRAIMKVEHEQ